MTERVSIHNHTHYSNVRILDAISSVEGLIDRAVEIGMKGIAITEHGNVCSAVKANQYEKVIQEKHPDFKVILGCEIYLTDTRDVKQNYYHCVLLARDAIGHQMIRELSSIAWINSYFDRGMERIPTLRSEIEEIIQKYGRNHLIMTQSCIGGRVNHHLSKIIECEEQGDNVGAKEHHKIIVDFMKWADKWFGEDFYLEVAPARYPDQTKVNSRMPALSKAFNKKIVIGDDIHRTRKEDYPAHKAFLNSQPGEREDIDKFYKYTYLQTDEECQENLAGTGLDYQALVETSLEIYNKVETYDLHYPQQVLEIEVKDFPKVESHLNRPVLDSLFNSDNVQERNWVNQCVDKLKEKGLYNDIYLDRLEEEADVQKTIGEALHTCIFAYPLFLQHYIDLFWESGSPVGVARGSGGAGLNHWLLGITQLDPIKYNLPYFRFLNKERIELPKL